MNQLTCPDRNYILYDQPPQLEKAMNNIAKINAAEQMQAWQHGAVDSLSSREEKETVPVKWSRHPIPIAREEFLALRYVAFIRFGLRQMRSSLEFLSYGFILLIIALNIYPFRGHHAIDIVMVVAFVILASSVVTMIAQMDRDPLLSRLSDTKPHELSQNFVRRVLSFGSLPLLTLIASVVPQVGHFLSSWIQPTLEALK
jgi:Flp pilus assembly protein TadB